MEVGSLLETHVILKICKQNNCCKQKIKKLQKPPTAMPRLVYWLDHYRRLQQRDGAFMAMLFPGTEPRKPVGDRSGGLVWPKW